MNERIYKLADRAGEYADFESGICTDEFLEKFAELVVKECIAQCNDGDSRYFIATHFGIPEARGWLCPSCGVDRSKEGCPKGHHAALTGHCPMVGVAQ
jgi:hypothetical protein